MVEIPDLLIVTLLPVTDTLSPSKREKVNAPVLLEVGFQKIGESLHVTISSEIDIVLVKFLFTTTIKVLVSGK